MCVYIYYSWFQASTGSLRMYPQQKIRGVLLWAPELEFGETLGPFLIFFFHKPFLLLANIGVPFLDWMRGPDISLNPGGPSFFPPVAFSSFLITTGELPLVPGHFPRLCLPSHAGVAKTFPGKNLQAETQSCRVLHRHYFIKYAEVLSCQYGVNLPVFC